MLQAPEPPAAAPDPLPSDDAPTLTPPTRASDKLAIERVGRAGMEAVILIRDQAISVLWRRKELKRSTFTAALIECQKEDAVCMFAVEQSCD